MPKVLYTKAKGLYQQSGTGVQSPYLASVASQGAGTTLANDSDAVTLTDADSGKAFQCDLASASKVLNLPTSPALGWNCRIVQSTALVGSGVLTIKATDGTDFFAIGSFYMCAGKAAAGDIAATTDDKLTITGAATNSGWGAGSYIDIVYVADNSYLVEAHGAMLGAGSTAGAFGAQ